MRLFRQLRSLVQFIWLFIIGPKITRDIIRTLAKLARIDLLHFAHEERGIARSQNLEVSGEKSFVHNTLPALFSTEDPIVFDIGANIGSFSKEIITTFPKARIFAFEPHPNTFVQLKNNLTGKNIELFEFGLSNEEVELELYDYNKSEGSAHASVYSEVFASIHKKNKPIAVKQKFTTLDKFCTEHNVTSIQLLKIDVEGHELEVLKGAHNLLSKKAIDIIHFEFNEMNVISRVFLKDFYDLLVGFNFHRLDASKLIPLGEYKSINEIFRFQNIVAVNPDLI